MEPRNVRFRSGSGEVICPRCFAPVRGAKRYFVEWSRDNHEFKVVLAFQCPPCQLHFEEEIVQLLPVTIAQQSTCSCGATLMLRNHSIRRTADDEIEFEGLYTCDECTMEKRSFVGQLRSIARSVWNKMTKLEIGPMGVKFEKAEDDK